MTVMQANDFRYGDDSPVGFYYSNVFSYYHASGNDFAETGPLVRSAGSCLLKSQSRRKRQSRPVY